MSANTFYDFTKTLIVNLSDYYKFNITPSTLFETDDCIYLSGIPCDKYTLAPITFYKDKPMTSLNTIGTVLAPYTSTRCFNRSFGDWNKQPYRIPYGPNQTMLKNNTRLSTGDEVIITPASTTVASIPAGRSSCAIVINKNTNKITSALHADLGNLKAGICILDDNRYLTTTNNLYTTADNSSSGRYDSYFTIFNRSTLSKSLSTLNTYGYIHNIIGTTTAGELLILNSIDTGSASTGITTFAVSKFNKSTLVNTNIITTQICPATGTGMNCGVPMEPAISLDCKTIYFPVMNTTAATGSGVGGKATYTINKYSVDIANGLVTNVPQTINLNGLVTSLNTIFNAQSGSYRFCPSINIMLTYLVVGSNNYLVATTTIDSPSTSDVYSPIYNSTTFANLAQYAMMYLFQINGDTLSLVDTKSLMGGTSDPVQTIFPMNNNSNILAVRNGGLDVITIDTTLNKFVTQITIPDPIFACGVDELERVWYLTSADLLVNDAKLKVFSVGTILIIKTDFVNPNYTFAGTSINTNINVSVQDNTGIMVTTNLQLLIEGNAVFTSNGLKTINVATSSTGVIATPITITGDGMINIYSNVYMGQ